MTATTPRGGQASRFDGRPLRWWVLGLGLAVAVMLSAGAAELARRRALDELTQRAQTAAALRAAILRSELEKYKALPRMLAADSDVQLSLRTGDRVQLKRLDQRLEVLAADVRTSAIYVVATTGRTMAASNWRRSDSFVGRDYGFRPYFNLALRTGSGAQFALGTISGRPGLYLAQRVESAEGLPLGVVVVKLEFDAVEAEWRKAVGPTFVTDARGIALVTNEPAWRFLSLAPLPPAEQALIRQRLEFGAGPLRTLPLSPDRGPPWGGRRFVHIDGRPLTSYLEVSAPAQAAPSGWTLHLLEPVRPLVSDAVWANGAMTFLVLSAMLGAVFVLVGRRDRLVARAAAAAAQNEELEREVAGRTAELLEANHRLRAEAEERVKAQDRLRRMHDDLAQANKLASLGQIAAGVAHEINQPVASIRAYADNGVAFLERARPDAARRNLTAIAELTERIGAITAELRDFTRKSPRDPVPVDLGAAVDGALLLVSYRLKEQKVAVMREGDEPVRVLAERGRLEQVLLNLFQNALEAMDGRRGSQLTVRISVGAELVVVDVQDNGPGLPAQVAEQLFTPFLTTKTKGLGLGLVIARDIAAEFGGALAAADDTGGGARFSLTLRRAD